MSASQASCCGWLRSPHLRPARWNAPVGKFDHLCFCAVSVQSNRTVSFCPASRVARNAVAAAATFCVVGLLAAGDPAVARAAAVDGTAVGVVEPDVLDEHATASATVASATAAT